MSNAARCVLLVLALSNVVRAQDVKVDLVAPTDPLTPAEQQKKFHLPVGYEIQLVASEPEIQKPMNLSFDASGRLFVTQSIEYPFPAKEGDTPRDTIRLLTDTNGDGVPDKVSVFADGLNIPIGVTPVGDGVLGYGIPTIYHFRDADGDGQAEERTAYYSQFGSRDTHGMASSFTWWLDGWVYACHGFANDSSVKGRDGHEVKMNSGNTYRFRPDGSHIEQFTWGQVNPFGLAFDDLGNMYSADCHSRPLYLLLRGAYYPSFGKPDDGLGFGPEMITHSHGSTGICGVAWYGAENFPPEMRGTLFICNPVTGRINHDYLEPHGSSSKAIELPDFLTCDDPWFRPVDLKLGPDGALYVADFYNKIIGHYEVPLLHPGRDRERGRIWRISFTGNVPTATKLPPPHSPGPDLAKASLEELVAALGHKNITIRTHATHQLVTRLSSPAAKEGAGRVSPEALTLLRPVLNPATSTPDQTAHALWVLERLSLLDDELVASLAKYPDRKVRTHLARALSERPTWSDAIHKLVLQLALNENAFVRRAAADALGRHPRRDNVPVLLRTWELAQRKGEGDTHLVHVARMALRDNLRSLGTDFLPTEPRVYDERTRNLADVSLGLRNADGAAFLLAVLERPNHKLEFDRQVRSLHDIARYIPGDELSRVVELAASHRSADPPAQAAVLRAVQQGLQERSSKTPRPLREWQQELTLALLTAPLEDRVRLGLDLAREFRISAAADRVEPIAEKPSALRLPACECLSSLDAGRAVPPLKSLLADGAAPIPERQRAADLLGGANLPASREVLLANLATAPVVVQISIARGLSGSPEGAESLLQTLTQGKVSARLLQDQVVAEKLKAAKIDKLAERVESLVKDLPPEEDRVGQLIAARKDGFAKAHPEPAKGLAVYTKICANCHRLDNKGTKVGPDLDGIGLRGVDRLLEDVLNPSRDVDQAFRATLLALKDGTTLTGLVQREEGGVLVVINDQGKEVRVPADDVEERRALRLSPMPANIAEQLKPEEFFDLLAYVLAHTAKPAAGAK